MPPRKEQFSGALIGQALGDALGFNVEGYAPKVARQYVEGVMLKDQASKFGRKPFSFGQYTDDTQLMRELALSLVEKKGFDPVDFSRRMAILVHKEEIVAGDDSTEQAARRIIEGATWEESGVPAADNGSAARAAPVGLLYYDDPRQMIEVAYHQSRITHQDGRSAAGATIIAGAVALVLQAEDGLDVYTFTGQLSEWAISHSMIFAEGLQKLPEWLEDKRQERAAGQIAGFAFDGDAPEGIPTYVIGSVLWSLYAFLKTPDDYWRTVATAITAGGDAGTTAAMAGAISGAYNGIEVLPRTLMRMVNDRDSWGFIQLTQLGEQVHALRENLVTD